MNRLRVLAIASALWAFTPGAQAEEPRAIVERAIKAIGGEELLGMKGATVVRIRGQIVQPGITQKITLSGELLTQSRTARRYNLRVDFDGNKYEIVQVVVEGKGWKILPGGQVVDTPEEEIREIEHQLCQDNATSLLPLLKDKEYELTSLAESVIEGRAAVGIKAAYKGRPDSLLYFDKTTGVLVKTAYKNKQGLLLETILGDYREFGPADDERLLRDAGLTVDDSAVLAFLRRQAPDPAKLDRIRTLIRKLGDDSFETREQAAKDLVALEKAALPLLQQARKDSDAEVARRAGECLEQIEKRTNDVTLLAAVRVVGWTRPKGGAEVLLALLPGVDETVAKEARAALVVYADRDGKPDPALVKALDDKDAVRRAVAQAVLGKDGGVYLQQPGRRLFVRGLKQPLRSKYYEAGKPNFEIEVTQFQLVNLLEPKLFERPVTGKLDSKK